jgi:hypothetical protein
MTTVNISLPDSIARVFEQASEADKRKAEWLIEFVLRDLFDKHDETLSDVIHDISRRAAERGMTQEVLDDLLNASAHP